MRLQRLRARAVTRLNEASLLRRRRRLPEALEACEEALAAEEATGGYGATSLINFAALLIDVGRPGDAIVPAERAARLLEPLVTGGGAADGDAAAADTQSRRTAVAYCSALSNAAAARAADAAARGATQRYVRSLRGAAARGRSVQRWDEDDDAAFAGRRALIQAERESRRLLGPAAPLTQSASAALVAALSTKESKPPKSLRVSRSRGPAAASTSPAMLLP